MSGYFIYNGLNTANITGFDVTGQDSYTVASRNIGHQAIPGRSGDVLSDEGTYKQVKVVYHCTIDASEAVNGFSDILDTLSAALMTAKGYRILADGYHPGVYRMAVPDGNINIEALKPAAGSPYKVCNFDLTFSCKPQCYLSSGVEPVQVSSGDVLSNPTSFHASPVISITGSGAVTIGTQEIHVYPTCPTYPVIIDCETMDAYSNGGTNLNLFVSLPLADIKLNPGNNTITYDGPSAVSVTPRTWKL